MKLTPIQRVAMLLASIGLTFLFGYSLTELRGWWAAPLCFWCVIAAWLSLALAFVGKTP